MVERKSDYNVCLCVYYVFDVFSMHVVVSLGSQQWANLKAREGEEREGEREREEPVRRSGGEGESRQGEG